MDIKSYLENIGYTLIEDGSWWRTSALYRGGKNPTSLAIDKATGRFYDFATSKRGTLQSLIELTKGEKIPDFESFLEELQIEILPVESKSLEKSEKIWLDSTLDKLIPHYKFYEERKISKETLKTFKSGMFHSGSMNQRYVFPIFNSENKIHGWSGRDMTNKRDAKWKHIGVKKNWLYPLYVKDKDGSFPTQDAIKKTRTVYLVESIGDMLALWERGIKNVLVTFGLKLSSKIKTVIFGYNVSKVYISLNNDFNLNINHGKVGAINMFVDLTTTMDVEKLLIAQPIDCKDFGEMHLNDELFKKWEDSMRHLNVKEMHTAIYKYIVKELGGDASKNHLTAAKTIKGIYASL